jgi:hypothetical protein
MQGNLVVSAHYLWQRLRRSIPRFLYRESRCSQSGSVPAFRPTVPNDRLDPLFEASGQAVEEAIVNALVNTRV